jgi:SAM-dependent methyltransferase
LTIDRLTIDRLAIDRLAQSWLQALEARHFADLRFSEVTRALRALSSTYVERRTTALPAQKALDGAGKRAAFALYYGPIHFVLVRKILAAIGAPKSSGLVVDLGCGTGVAGAAVATAASPPARVVGIDLHPWALDEARFTYRTLGLNADVRRGHAARTCIPHDASFVVAAFVVNELNDGDRQALLESLHAAAARGVSVLVVEPISRGISPWWDAWAEAFTAMGGRADEWRIPFAPPTLVKRLARASGLRPGSLTARSLFVQRL